VGNRLAGPLGETAQIVYSVLRQEVAVMSPNAKRAIVKLLGGAGLIFLVIGATTAAYPTVAGVIIMLVCWLLAGVARSYWGMDLKGVR
jgi:hypothetical protein